MCVLCKTMLDCCLVGFIYKARPSGLLLKKRFLKKELRNVFILIFKSLFYRLVLRPSVCLSSGSLKA